MSKQLPLITSRTRPPASTLDLTRRKHLVTRREATERRLAIHVVATTLDGTRTALLTACSLSRDLHAQIELLVPHIVPYTQPLDRPADSVAFAGERFRRLAETLVIDVVVRVCLCRPHSATLVQLLPSDGLIVVGGRRRRWFRTREERLTSELARHGRRVLFVDQLEGVLRIAH